MSRWMNDFAWMYSIREILISLIIINRYELVSEEEDCLEREFTITKVE